MSIPNISVSRLVFLHSSFTLSISSVMSLKFTTAFECDVQNLALNQFCGISPRGFNVFFFSSQ